MKYFIDCVARFFVGCLFVFSGLIKLNDPIGTEIKMEEYFDVFSSDFGSFFHALIPWAMEIGLMVIILEVGLGVAVLLYYQMKITSWVALGLVVFFAGLTFYSAYFNKVTDCGCFGDAIELTPWQSFYKDIAIMIFVLHLVWYRKTYISAFSSIGGHVVAGGSVLTSLFLGVYAIHHLPFIDFRPYKVGNNIPELMLPKEQPIIEYSFKKNEELVTSTRFLSKKEGYTYISSKVLNEDKITPQIIDYNVVDVEGNNLTSYTFEGTKFLVILYDVSTIPIKNMDVLHRVTQHLKKKADCLILTSLTAEQVKIFRHNNQLNIPFYYTDATVLKTMLRSNPGVTLWKDGKVLGKWHYHDIPNVEEIEMLL